MFVIDYFLEYNRFLNLLGIAVILGVAGLFSRNRKAIDVRLVFTALGMQVLIAFLALKTSAGQWVLQKLADMFASLYQAADVGIHFVFGALGDTTGPWGCVFAFKVLPVTIFFGAFMSLLFYMGVIKYLVGGIGFIFRPLLKTSGAETLCAAANSFLGQTEAPLVIRQYLKNLTRSELLVVMVSGMGTLSAVLIAVYGTMGISVVHLLAASVMGVPATILIAKILYPQTEKAETAEGAMIVGTGELPTGNIFSALFSGTSDGLWLALNVGAMLIAFIALIGLANSLLGWFCGVGTGLFAYFGSEIQIPCLTFQMIFGWLFSPVAWLLGLTGDEITKVGSLIGTKLVLNELIAYGQVACAHLSDRALLLATYALCGFANFSSIGIQIAGIGALAPDQRHTVAQLGLLAVLGGTLANLLSAMIVGLLL